MNTVIGESSHFEGEFDIAGSIKVEGTLKGRLRATERLVIGESGTVLADIVVRDAIIGGEFTGIIDAESRVELEGTARVRGELKTRHLIIQEGAIFQGNVDSGEEGSLTEDMEVTAVAAARDT
jgi:cytoskeletal protein CcmA (bactofilin family)